MNKRRKPRAPAVSSDGLKDHKNAIEDRELWQLANRLEEFERLRKDKVLNTPFIALEALGALSGGLVSGRTEEQLRTAWPAEWGQDTITVPLSLLLALRDVWDNYKQASSGRTLGEAFQIEGGSQGKHPMKSKLATIDRARKLARKVEINYLQLEGDTNPMRIEDAIQTVADENEVSFVTVKEAYDDHKKHIRSSLEELGLLKGVKTSRS
jgi:hypothetical protein